MNHGPQRLQPRPGPIAVALLVLASGAASVHAGECVPGWDPVFGIPGINSGVVFDFTTHDDGSGRGDELYASGSYTTLGGAAAARIARWDGAQWTALGSGLTGPGLSPSVMCMAGFDDGTGAALYVGGQTFDNAGGVAVSRIARWDGAAWSAVGDGFADGVVWDLEVFDDGTGPALYAFGTFTASGETALRGVARWTGTAWVGVDGGTNESTYGAAVFVGGRYTAIGGVDANGIGRFNTCDTRDLPGDVNGDGVVDTADLVALLSTWGDCPPEGECPGDFDGNGTVDFNDLLVILVNWS